MKLKLALALLSTVAILNCGDDPENVVIPEDGDSTEVADTNILEKDSIVVDSTGDTTTIKVKDTVVTVVTKPVVKDTITDTTKPDDKDTNTNTDNSGITLESSLAYEVLDEDEAEAADLAKMAKILAMELIPSKNRVFTMGATEYYNEELVSEFSQPFAKVEEEKAMPAHLVKFSYNFFMRKTEVTAGEFAEIMNEATSYFHDSTSSNGSTTLSSLHNSVGNNEMLYADNGPETNSGIDYNQSKDELQVLTGASQYVAHSISWYGAAFFCNALSRKYGLEEVYDRFTWKADYSKNGFRLPTEAEWEYACKAGTDTPFFWGDIDKVDESDDYVVSEVGFVAQKKANNFGLYDMIGNVREYCTENYREFSSASEINVGFSEIFDDSDCVIKGGFKSDIDLLSTWRNGWSKESVNELNGFRYVLPIKK